MRLQKKIVSAVLAMTLITTQFGMTEKKIHARDITSFAYSAQQTVDDMGVGWNLGNSLDASVGWGTDETSWGNPRITKEMIDTIKQAGFRTIRIPTTWTYHMGEAPEYTIESSWMNRVEEVVNYALDNDLYVILNTHHESKNIIPNYENRDRCAAMIGKIWTQIANRFEKYGNNLIFEVLNEPKIDGGENEWNGGTWEVRDVLNTYNEVALNAIRATGGNNQNRKVMLPSVAASVSDAALNDLKIPNDSNVIVSVHAYSPYSFAMEYPGTDKYTDQGGTDWQMNNLYNRYVSKGIPVIIGEWGSVNKNNLDERIKHAKYYVAAARKKGITCVWWDNNNSENGSETFGILNRRSLSWNFPGLVEGMIQSEAAEAKRNETPIQTTAIQTQPTTTQTQPTTTQTQPTTTQTQPTTTQTQPTTTQTQPTTTQTQQDNGWRLYDYNGNAVKESENVIRINNIGTENWQPHYYRSNLAAEQGQAYYFTAILKSSIDRTVTVHMQIPDNNYETLFTQDIALKANEAQAVKIYVPAQNGRKTGIKLTICLGSIHGETEYPSHTVEVSDAEVSVTPDREPETTRVEETTRPSISYDWGFNPEDLDYQDVSCTGDDSKESLGYGLKDTTMEGLNPWYGDGGNTFMLQYADPNAEGVKADVKVNGEQPGSGVITEKAQGLVKVNPNTLPDNSYTVVTVTLDSGKATTFVIKKGTPTGEPTQTTRNDTTFKQDDNQTTEQNENNTTNQNNNPTTVSQDQPTTGVQTTTVSGENVTTAVPSVSEDNITTAAPSVSKVVNAKVGKTKVKKATKKKAARKMKVTLKKIAGANDYQVRIYKTKKDAKKNKKAIVKKTMKKITATIKSKKLANQSKLFVRARTCQVVDNQKKYSKWSKVKKVKIQ